MVTAVKPADTRISVVKSADTEIVMQSYTDIYGKLLSYLTCAVIT